MHKINKVYILITLLVTVTLVMGCNNGKEKNVITNYSSGPAKVIYDFVKARNGEAVANKIVVTDPKILSDELGYRFNIYQYSEYTGQDEFIMFYLKQKEDGDWYIHKRIPEA